MVRMDSAKSREMDRRAIQGDSALEFERLYLESYPLVYNYAYRCLLDRIDVEDVVSESFLRAAHAFDRFDPDRAKFSTWAVAILRNCIAEHCRVRLPLAPIDDVVDDVHAHTDHAEHISNADLVRRLLNVLTVEERELVTLKYYADMRNTEIAEELGLNPSTVSTRLSRALAKMREAALEMGEGLPSHRVA